MKMPLVSRGTAELLRERVAQLEGELATERDANKKLMASALALRGIGDPYRPAPSAPVGRPIGRKSADKILLEMERSERAAMAIPTEVTDVSA